MVLDELIKIKERLDIIESSILILQDALTNTVNSLFSIIKQLEDQGHNIK